MRVRTAAVAIVCLLSGLAGGYFLPPARPAAPAVADAGGLGPEAALREIATWCGYGSKTAWRVLDLVRAAAAGGEAILPQVAEAIRSAAPWSYDLPGWSIDPQSGTMSVLPTRRTALLEVAARIGGPGASEVLRKAAVESREWSERASACLLLSRRIVEPEIRRFLTERLRTLLRHEPATPEAVRLIEILRGRLEHEAAEFLIAALKEGRADETGLSGIAACLAIIDRSRAGTVFLEVATGPAVPTASRVAAAGMLARLAERRPEAAAALVKGPSRDALRAFVKGLKFGRVDEIDLYRAALESGDPAVGRAYSEARLADVADAERVVDQLASMLTPELAEVAGIPTVKDELRAAVEDGSRRLRALDEQRR
jgi:hypothetical protein